MLPNAINKAIVSLLAFTKTTTTPNTRGEEENSLTGQATNQQTVRNQYIPTTLPWQLQKPEETSLLHSRETCNNPAQKASRSGNVLNKLIEEVPNHKENGDEHDNTAPIKQDNSNNAQIIPHRWHLSEAIRKALSDIDAFILSHVGPESVNWLEEFWNKYPDEKALDNSGKLPITASAIFPAEKYRLSKYIAEPMSTLSSGSMLWFALKAFNHPEWRELPLIVKVLYISEFTVGLGSTAFHATLTRPGQVGDEFPMAIGMFCFLFAVLNEYIHLPSNEDLIEDSIKRSRARKLSLLRFISYYRQALLMISVSTLAMCYTMIYFSNPAPFILDFTFGFLVVAVVGFLASMSSPAAPLSNLGKYVLAMVFGFACWLFENNNATRIREFKMNHLNEAGKALFDLHSVWHGAAAYGIYGMVGHLNMIIKDLEKQARSEEASELNRTGELAMSQVQETTRIFE